MFTALAVLAASAALLYFIIKTYIIDRNSDFWDKWGGPEMPRLVPEFTVMEIMGGKKSLVDIIMNNDNGYYRKLGDLKFGGTVELGIPTLFVKDLDLARNIFVKDFEHFTDRRAFGKDGLFSESLIFLQGEKWKNMRSFLSPTFTSGKIRRMFDQFEQGGIRLQNYVTEKCPKSKSNNLGYDVDLVSLTRKYTVDVIASVAFGMETNAFTDDDSIFYKMATRSSDLSTMRIIRMTMLAVFPKLAEYFGLTTLDKETNDFFKSMLTQALRARENSKGSNKRTDFLQLLVEAKTSDMKIDESELNEFEKEAQINSNSKTKLQISENMAVAQGFLFFVAGFDTVANFLSVALYTLAAYPELQDKLYESINTTANKSGGKVTYEGINEMEYLDQYSSEVLRMYPTVQRLERKCVKTYTIPGTNVIIPKDTMVAIPTEGIHLDEKYYPNPMKFDPERFNAENKANRNVYAYQPFGIGPRNCIGMRFALIEAKVALANLVKKFIIQPSEKTPIPVKVVKKMGMNRVENGLELRFVPRT